MRGRRASRRAGTGGSPSRVQPRPGRINTDRRNTPEEIDPMKTRWSCTPALMGLGLSFTLAAAVAGCGQGGETSDAVLTPSPDVNLTSKGAPSPAAAPAGGGGAATAPTPAAATAATPVKAEGCGTLKGRVVYGGDPPQPKVLQEKGKAIKDPDICAKDAPIMSERLVVDSGTKGVKNVFVYLMRP